MCSISTQRGLRHRAGGQGHPDRPRVCADPGDLAKQKPRLAISALYLVSTVYLYYLSAVSILQVTAYNAEGYLADLPSLTTGRYSHGCGHFVNTADREVGRGGSQSIHRLETVQNTLTLCAGVPGDRGRPLPLHGLHGGAGGGGGGLEGGRAPAQPQVRAAGGQL